MAGKPRGLKKDGTPNAHWTKFKEKLNSFETVPVNDWETEQVLGYMLKRFQDVMGIEWSFSYTGGPSNCQELFCVKRMITALGTEDWVKVKRYIDFVYDKYIISQKVNVTSLGFFFNKKFILEFKAECRKQKTITRTTKLPAEYIKIVDPLGLSTYGDLVFAKMSIDSDPEFNLQYIDLFNKLEQVGFKKEVLEKLSA